MLKLHHHERFKKYHNLLTSGKLFNDQSTVKWMCMNCGFIYEGTDALTICPVCKHPQGYSLRLDESQFHL